MKKKMLRIVLMGAFAAFLATHAEPAPVKIQCFAEEKYAETKEKVIKSGRNQNISVQAIADKNLVLVQEASENSSTLKISNSQEERQEIKHYKNEVQEQSSDSQKEEVVKEDALPDAASEVNEVESQIYQYCPTNINGNILYCSNEANPGEVKDGIYLNGEKVLSTSDGAWDSAQVCDPSVVGGNFTFNGNNYTYLMAYLGCTTFDSTNNEIGFAVSNDLYNWTKVGKIISCIGDGYWGVGQPSIMNINGDGNIYLFYTSGTAAKTTTYVAYLDCNDLSNIATLGTAEITNQYDFISNADFGYSDGYLYMTCDTHPFGGNALNFISDKQTVYKAVWDKTFDGINTLSWEIETTIGNENTGYLKNHNACFSRDTYGNLSGRTLYVSVASEVGDFIHNLCTYRFMPVNF